MTIGEWILEQRRKRGWSRDTLAFESHISARLLAKYESGESEPGTTNLTKIAQAYGVPLPWSATASKLGWPGWPTPVSAGNLALAGQ